MTPPRPDAFLIGDLHTAAIVRSGGEIAWLCLPSFEGPSVFASMTEERGGGSWSIDWSDAATSYLPYGAIAESTGTVNGAKVTVRDFMVPRTGDDPATHVLVRRLRADNACTLRMTFDPRPNNGRERPVFREESWGQRVRLSDRELRLYLPEGTVVTRRPNKEGLSLSVPLSANEPIDVMLSYGDDDAARPGGKRDLEERTAVFWKNWVTGGNFTFSRPHLVRAAITLKLLQFSPTGGILASVTSPDRAVRLRDAAFALYACYVLGYDDDAARFFAFLEEAAMDAKECDAGTCDLRLPASYTARGQAIMGKEEHAPFPFDVYGSLIDAYYFMTKRGMRLTPEGKDVVHMLARGLLLHPEPSVMAWLGLDRAVRMADALDATTGTVSQWKKARDEIANAARKNIDGSRGDPNVYLYVLLQFLDRHDPCTRAIVLETERALGKTKGSRTVDFQRIAALAAVGEHERAEKQLRAIEDATPPSGLIVEDGDIAASPHIGSIMAAYYLHRYAPPTGGSRNPA